MDIDFILNGKKKPKKQKDNLKDLMIGNRPQGTKNMFLRGKSESSIIGDKITKKQKKVFKKAKKKKSFMPLFGDWDKDGVINALDCAPRNKKKHAYVQQPNSDQDVEEYVVDRFGNPEEYPKKIRLYHGTRTGNLDKIKKEGLRPQSKTGNKNYSGISPKYKDKVYMTQNKSNASFWATQNKNEGEPVMVEADVPFEEYEEGLKRYEKRYSEDPMVRDESRDEILVERVPPESIKKVTPYSNAIIEKELRTDPRMHGRARQEREQEQAEKSFKETFNDQEEQDTDQEENNKADIEL